MQSKSYSILVILGLCALTSATNLQEEFSKGFTILAREGRETEELKNAIKLIKFPHLFRGHFLKEQENPIEKLVCSFCVIALDIVEAILNNGTNTDLVFNAFIYLCINFRRDSEEVCRGHVETQRDTILFIALDPHSKATPERICSMSLLEYNCPYTSEPWQVEIPDPIESKLDRTFTKKNFKVEPLKIIQITDLHYDPNYEVGSNAACGDPLCCRKGTKPATPNDAAGYWTDYRSCNLPWHSVINILNQIVTQHSDIDYIYFTGDIINHKWWQTSVSDNKEDLIKVFQQFKKSFGHLPVFPVLGNHDPHPSNQYSFNVTNTDVSTMWLFKLAAEQWSQWLPEETKPTILKGGYYTVKTKQGLRIIALNSNVCYVENLWQFYDDVDPYEQLKWLTSVLAQAEIDNENVHIISHIPSGDSSCLQNWAREFVRVVTRFSKTIVAQFNGHSHYDDTVLFFKENTDEVINVEFNGGSLVPYSNLNPNYKLYHVDHDDFNVLDYETWSYNLTEANLNPQAEPRWRNTYNFTSQYNVPDLSYSSLFNLVNEMALKPELNHLQSYFRNKHREADTVLVNGCDTACELENLCTIVTYDRGNDFHCNKYTEMYNNARPILDGRN